MCDQLVRQKNWLGAFAVPYAVINDFAFLHSQDPQISRAGLIEAVKVALVKDPEFFRWIEANLTALAALDPSALETCVERSALWHARHIANGGDAFESGSSRPLDFGHWSAHKLESLTDHEVSHAEAVAIGVALDTLYSVNIGLLAAESAGRFLRVIETLRLATYHPALAWLDENGRRRIFAGLDEFRKHLGTALTPPPCFQKERSRSVLISVAEFEIRNRTLAMKARAERCLTQPGADEDDGGFHAILGAELEDETGSPSIEKNGDEQNGDALRG